MYIVFIYMRSVSLLKVDMLKNRWRHFLCHSSNSLSKQLFVFTIHINKNLFIYTKHVFLNKVMVMNLYEYEIETGWISTSSILIIYASITIFYCSHDKCKKLQFIICRSELDWFFSIIRVLTKWISIKYNLNHLETIHSQLNLIVLILN